MSHFLFVGVDHDFNVKHSVMGRVGVEYAMYPDAIDALGMRDDAWAPYVDAMYQYLLTEDSRVQVGIKSEMYQTDVALATLGGGAPTQDAWSSTAYAAFTYEITPRLIGMVRGLAQWSQFNGGIADDDWDSFYSADLNLTYEINRYLDAEIGYAFDRLDSDIPTRRYSRNRVYFGVRATY